MNEHHKSSSHAVFSIKPHVVLVTKFRRKTEPAPVFLDTNLG